MKCKKCSSMNHLDELHLTILCEVYNWPWICWYICWSDFKVDFIYGSNVFSTELWRSSSTLMSQLPWCSCLMPADQGVGGHEGTHDVYAWQGLLSFPIHTQISSNIPKDPPSSKMKNLREEKTVWCCLCIIYIARILTSFFTFSSHCEDNDSLQWE